MGYDQANWRGAFPSESAADAAVQAIGDVVFFGGTVRVVTAYTARSPDRFQWTRIRDDELIARVDEVVAAAGANTAAVGRLSVFGTAQLSPPGIPDRTFPEFMALRLDNRITDQTIIEIRVLIEDTPIATVNTEAALAPFNRFTAIQDEAVGPTGGIINIALNSTTRQNLQDAINSGAQYTRFDIHYKFTGTSLATNVGADAIDRIHFGVNNNGFPAPGGGLTQSQVDARVLALRSLATTSATPVAGDRFFFTDENQPGDPLVWTQFRTLAAAIHRTYTAKTATAGASNTWTYTLAAEDTELWIGTEIVNGSSNRGISSTVIPRAILTSTARQIVIDHRNPEDQGSGIPDAQSVGVAASISGNTLTLVTTNWGNQARTPMVYSK